MINKYLKIAVVMLLSPAFANANEHNHADNHDVTPLELIVYKTPTCGCCKKWITHIEDEGIVAHSKDFRNISNIKTKYGIKPNYRSCHTAVSRNGFAFEGHVPAKFIQQFLSEEHPNAIGLSVPAMPVGSPGMEVGDRFMPYKVLILFKDGTSEVYAKVKTYEEQF
ncbi:DUF411 domain-containing protein [Alteromonas sp. LMIT006]|jgi:hypothetical protein|uniref:DUF411 domain-containing protein n=1 Tax=Alteromonadaceae TaxID=72275 RepID=UPI0020CA5DFF|nr:DUF411 domain-containing protein [Alteromonas sp. LMIT006]UTP73181.1 DUF411 domain-containing protein [Alteromonas sp. LMIT006]